MHNCKKIWKTFVLRIFKKNDLMKYFDYSARVSSFFLVFILSIVPNYFAQPGYYSAIYYFNIIDQEKINQIEMQWRNGTKAWEIGIRKGSQFETGSVAIRNYSPLELKFYRKGSADTMFVICNKSMSELPFRIGKYDLTGALGYLFNIKTLGNTVISNQNMKSDAAIPLPMLQKTRYVYVPRNYYPSEMNDPDVQYSSFAQSFHIKTSGAEDVDNWLTIGKIYHDPKQSPYFYTLANYTRTEDAISDSDYYWLLESTDGLKTWRNKFKLKHNIQELLNFQNGIFTFATFNRKDEIVQYSSTGLVLNQKDFDGVYCNLDINKFYTCDTDLFPFADGSKSISSPIMTVDNNPHLYHTFFTWNNETIELSELPYKPNTIKIKSNNESEESAVIKLNTKETYVYITQRKNKVVVLSYNYTMVSSDFGKTWIFYSNALIAGGSWNVFWLNDNTICSINNMECDFIKINN